MKIWLSPSNQTANIGAYSNTNECEQCERFANYAKNFLTANYNCEVQIATRADNMSTRCAKAKEWGADFYLAIHTNAFSDASVHGTETYYHSTDTEGKAFATKLLQAVSAITGVKRSVKTYDSLIELNTPTCTRAYIEVDFHTNVTQAAWMIENAQLIGETIGQTIADYYSLEATGSADAPFGYAMAEMSAAAVGTKVYLFGGVVNTSGTRTDAIHIYDTTTKTVTTATATLPQAMSDIRAIAIGTKIYLIGGWTQDGYTNIIQVYDTSAGTISTLSATLTAGISHIAAAAVGTKIYILGGYTDDMIMSDAIQVFDTTNNTLTVSAYTLPSAMAYMHAAAVGTKIYLIGGIKVLNEDTALSTIQVFDTTTGTITTLLNTMVEATPYISVVAVDTKVYIFGGESNSIHTNTIQALDTSANTLKRCDEVLPNARYGIGAAAVESNIYLCGGYDATGENMFATIDVFKHTASTTPETPSTDFDDTSIPVWSWQNRTGNSTWYSIYKIEGYK